jgi:hypothetical protein
MRLYHPVLATVSVTLLSIPMTTALAKQQCSSSIASNPHGYWSWRIIDGRKCWYEGKPMLPKSSLEWPAQTAMPKANERPPTHDPLDAQAEVPISEDPQAKAPDFETFDALWRARIDHF